MGPNSSRCSSQARPSPRINVTSRSHEQVDHAILTHPLTHPPPFTAANSLIFPTLDLLSDIAYLLTTVFHSRHLLALSSMFLWGNARESAWNEHQGCGGQRGDGISMLQRRRHLDV